MRYCMPGYQVSNHFHVDIASKSNHLQFHSSNFPFFFENIWENYNKHCRKLKFEIFMLFKVLGCKIEIVAPVSVVGTSPIYNRQMNDADRTADRFQMYKDRTCHHPQRCEHYHVYIPKRCN